MSVMPATVAVPPQSQGLLMILMSLGCAVRDGMLMAVASDMSALGH